MALAPCSMYSRAADRSPFACPGAGQVEVTSDTIPQHRYVGAHGPPAVAGTEVIVLPLEPIGRRVWDIELGHREEQHVRRH